MRWGLLLAVGGVAAGLAAWFFVLGPGAELGEATVDAPAPAEEPETAGPGIDRSAGLASRAPLPSDPDLAYEAALALTLGEVTANDPQEAGRRMQADVRHLTESVERAATAQRAVARRDPSRTAAANERVATLYEHAAAQLEGAPTPPHLDASDAAAYREAMADVAELKRAQAAAVRGAP